MARFLRIGLLRLWQSWIALAIAARGMSLSGKTMYGWTSSKTHRITLSDNYGKSFHDTHSPPRRQWNDVGCDGSGDRAIGVSSCTARAKCEAPVVTFDHGRSFVEIPLQASFDPRHYECKRVALARANLWSLLRCEDRASASRAETVFASQDLIHWTPAGDSWLPSPDGDVGISFDGSLFAAINSTQVLLSNDHGATWSDAGLSPRKYNQVSINHDGDTIAVGYSTDPAERGEFASGVLVSHDRGHSWAEVHGRGLAQACNSSTIVSTNAAGSLVYISSACFADYVFLYNASTHQPASPLVGSSRQVSYGAWTNGEGDFVYSLTYPDQLCSHDFGQSFVNCAELQRR